MIFPFIHSHVVSSIKNNLFFSYLIFTLLSLLSLLYYFILAHNISQIQISYQTMQDENYSTLLTYSNYDDESIPNKNTSFKPTQFQQYLQRQPLNYEEPYTDQLIVKGQSYSQQQLSYQSLDYGQKIAVSHNILKGLVHMLDHKFPTICPNKSEPDLKSIEKPVIFPNLSQMQSKNPKFNQKLEEKMLEVRDRLSQIITFINREMDSRPPKAVQNTLYVDAVKEQLQEVQAETLMTFPAKKELNEINHQQKINQQKTPQSVKIVIDKNKLYDAKQVYSQEILNFHNQEGYEPKEYMKSSLDKISEAVSGETVEIKSNRISEINHNLSQVKSEQQRAQISFNFQENNSVQLDETGRIILSTINKKTISTTTIPKNVNKAQNKPSELQKEHSPSENMGREVRKNKFWKEKSNSHKNNQLSQEQIQSKKSENVIKENQQVQQGNRKERSSSKNQTRPNAINQDKNPLASNPRRVFQRNYSLNEFRRSLPKQHVQSLPNSKIKPTFEENPSTASQMRQSNIIKQFSPIPTSPSDLQQPRRPQNINPEVITRAEQPRIIINQPSNLPQQRHQNRLNLTPQPSNRPHSLPNNLNRNNTLPFRASLPSNIPNHLVQTAQNKVIMNSRPSLNNYPIIARNNPIFTGQKHTELPKSPTINRKINFPQRSQVLPLPQVQNTIVPTSFLHAQPQLSVTNAQVINALPITTQLYQPPQPQTLKKLQSISRFRPISENQLQKIIELSQQSIQNSLKKDNRSDLSLQTSAHNLHLSNVSHSTSIMNGRPLKKRGIHITSKQYTNVQLIQ